MSWTLKYPVVRDGAGKLIIDEFADEDTALYVIHASCDDDAWDMLKWLRLSDHPEVDPDEPLYI